MKGKMIVFEGTDGSGKATQSNLLCEHLEALHIPFMKIDFPRYGCPSAAMVEEYLDGNLGTNPDDVNAYAASVFYAIDRYASYRQISGAYGEAWGAFYEAGGLIVADRYTTSNAIHQASKLPPESREAFLEWLFDLEYRKFELPNPNLVFYLNLPVEATEKMMRKREQETNTKADIHEKDTAYLKECQANAADVVKLLQWNVIDCVKDGEIKTPEDIHNEVWDQVCDYLKLDSGSAREI